MWNFNFVVAQSPDTEFNKWCVHDYIYEPTYLERCMAELDTRPELVGCHSRTCYINEYGDELMRSFRQQGFTDHRPWVRFNQIVLVRHDDSYVFALLRRSVVSQIRPLQPVYGGHAILLAELAFHGPFGEVARPDSFSNRMHPTRATALIPKGREALMWAKWFGVDPLPALAHATRVRPQHGRRAAERRGESPLLRRFWPSGWRAGGRVSDGSSPSTGHASCATASPPASPRAREMNVSDVWTWEDLGSLPGWSELAAHCDASPFSWPSYCLPWWYEVGWGKLLSVAVEELGAAGRTGAGPWPGVLFGRPTFRFCGRWRGHLPPAARGR